MAWLLDWWFLVRGKKGDALSEIRDRKAVFEESVIAADAAGTMYNQSLIPSVLARFNQLESEIGQAKTRSQIGQLVDQADDLAQLRAYVCPLNEIVLQGKAALSTMEDWSVPSSALDALKRDIVPHLSSDDLNTARGALHTLLEEYGSWSDYIDNYNSSMANVTYCLALLIAVSLGSAIWLLSSGFLVLGLLAAGSCGACVSVVSKVPTLTVSGDSAPYLRGIWKRVCTGIAASVIGSGFLVLGLVTIMLPEGGSLKNVIEECATPHALQSIKSTAVATTESPGLPQIAVAESGGCKQKNVLVLVALVMLFGLSERALTSFEERVFPSKP